MDKLKRVSRCDSPAIKEAFCLIQGVPAEIDDSEAPALEIAAKKYFENKDIKLEPVPTFVVIPMVKNKKMSGFWSQQSKWAGPTNLCRFGHRYLSVHRLCNKKNPYISYEKSLLPQIKEWIELYKNTLVSKRDSHEIAHITFGYINEFDFKLKDFEVNKYINLDFNISLDSSLVDVLNAISQRFDFSNADKNINCTVKVDLKSSQNIPEGISLTVEIYSTFGELVGMSYNSNDIIDKVFELKNHAKDTFFSLATSTLRDEVMKAKYD